MKNAYQVASVITGAILSATLLMAPGAATAQVPTPANEDEPDAARAGRARRFDFLARVLTVFDRGGKVTDTLGERAMYFRPVFSPDATRVAVIQADMEAQSADLWVFDVATGNGTRITSSQSMEGVHSPVWSPDGTRILFSGDRTDTQGEDLFIRAADGSAPEQLILSGPATRVFPQAWLPNDTIVFRSNAAGNEDLFMYSISAEDEPEPYLEAPWQESQFSLSLDGTLAAVVTSETGTAETWLTNFPTPEERVPVSFGGGSGPRWSSDGRTLYFVRRDPAQIWAVDLETEPEVHVGEPRFVLDNPALSKYPAPYDVAPDGLILTTIAADTPPAPVTEVRILPKTRRPTFE